MYINYPPQTKLREGNIFTCVCLCTGGCVRDPGAYVVQSGNTWLEGEHYPTMYGWQANGRLVLLHTNNSSDYPVVTQT